jgi:6-pyruvoyltetrahydropterin/6-carboxytetrahydropterin synthase
MKIRITKLFHFEMAHALEHYDGPCRDIHGHSYSLSVTVGGEPIIDRMSPKLGMVMDFGDLKRLVKEHLVDRFDHALVIRKGYENALLKDGALEQMKIILTEFQPTSEQLILHFAEVLQKVLPHHITLERLKLLETHTSWVEWRREDQ